MIPYTKSKTFTLAHDHIFSGEYYSTQKYGGFWCREIPNHHRYTLGNNRNLFGANENHLRYIHEDKKIVKRCIFSLNDRWIQRSMIVG
mgnify:CR=1 FL=1